MSIQLQVDKWADFRRYKNLDSWLRIATLAQAIALALGLDRFIKTWLLQGEVFLTWLSVWVGVCLLLERRLLAWPCPKCGKRVYYGIFWLPPWECASCRARPPSEEDSSG